MLGLHPFPHICNRSQEPSRIQLSAESKHLKGQLGPPVSEVTFFASKEVSWTPRQGRNVFFARKEVSWTPLSVT